MSAGGDRHVRATAWKTAAFVSLAVASALSTSELADRSWIAKSALMRTLFSDGPTTFVVEPIAIAEAERALRDAPWESFKVGDCPSALQRN